MDNFLVCEKKGKGCEPMAACLQRTYCEKPIGIPVGKPSPKNPRKVSDCMADSNGMEWNDPIVMSLEFSSILCTMRPKNDNF